MQLTIVLRKEVPDEATAQALFDAVLTKMEEYPNVNVTGSVSSQMQLPPEDPPE